MTALTCLSWNLAHQTRERPIPDEVFDVLHSADVHVAMFNEFVDGPSRADFRERLKRARFSHVKVSTRVDSSNQVLIASQRPLEAGHLRSPMPDTVAPSNWYHVRIPSLELDLVHFRMPSWKTAAQKHRYRAELADIVVHHTHRPLVLCGDFNHDPFDRQPDGLTEVNWLGLDDLVVPRPEGPWSFMGRNGGTSRVDHVAHTRCVEVTDVRYVTEAAGALLAGHPTSHTSGIRQPISDHAALMFTIRAR